MIKLPLRIDREFSLRDAALAMQGTLSKGGNEVCRGISLDTRTLEKNDLFFAIAGSRDGHEFLSQAKSKGAAAAVVHQDVALDLPLIHVDETQKALSRFARNVRTKWGGKVVAISGSNGKTTTKEMTTAVLRAHMKTHRSPGTWNNFLGVPLTLLMLDHHSEAVVLEMGMNNYGELRSLCEAALPDISVLTNVGPAHLEKFGTIDGVAKAKQEIFESLTDQGTAVVNRDDPWIMKMVSAIRGKKLFISQKEKADVSAVVKKDLGSAGMILTVNYGGENVEITSPFLGQHNIYNLLCAFGVAHALKVPSAKLQQGVDAIERPEMRLEVFNLPSGIKLINDCYNANPASMIAGLQTCGTLAHGGRMIAVLGDMAELGDYAPRAHREIGMKVSDLRFTYLLGLGQFFGDTAQGAIQGGLDEKKIIRAKNHADLVDEILKIIQPGDTILVKASRAMHMESVTEPLREKLNRRSA